jgi:hypothetical protein
MEISNVSRGWWMEQKYTQFKKEREKHVIDGRFCKKMLKDSKDVSLMAWIK